MIFESLLHVLFEVLIKGAGNLVLGGLGWDLQTKGAADDWLVIVAGIGFWAVLGALVIVLVKWLV